MMINRFTLYVTNKEGKEFDIYSSDKLSDIKSYVDTDHFMLSPYEFSRITQKHIHEEDLKGTW